MNTIAEHATCGQGTLLGPPVKGWHVWETHCQGLQIKFPWIGSGMEWGPYPQNHLKDSRPSRGLQVGAP